MKKVILSAVAAALVATPLLATEASAQTRTTTVVQHKPNGVVVRKRTVVHAPNRVVVTRKWTRGQRFDRRYAPNYRVIDYRWYRNHRLYAPPRGYYWVRSGNDAVLVGITSGVIGAVIANALIN